MDPSSTSIGASSCSFPASQRKRKYESRYELLECPICLDLPRSGPLFGCKNGHLICNLCREKMSEKRIQCPVCRSSDVHCRNLIAEKLMEELLENNNILFECRFSTEGCKEKKEGRRIGDHEASCWYRCVECPSAQFSPCKWKGPIKNLVKHFAATRCAQVLKTSAQTSQFSSSICDFPLKNSVFKRSTKTHWKPVLLFSPLTVAFFIYLNISRDKNGIWSLSAKAYAPPSIMESLSVELCAHSPSTEFPRRAFTYFGKIHPSSASDKEIIASGEHLLLADAQVLSLMKDSKLFQYSVKINKAPSKKSLP